MHLAKGVGNITPKVFTVVEISQASHVITDIEGWIN